jgi:hypothetical protein
MEKMENKERFPLSHGTAATICMNLFTKFVALGVCIRHPPGGCIRHLFPFYSRSGAQQYIFQLVRAMQKLQPMSFPQLFHCPRPLEMIAKIWM